MLEDLLEDLEFISNIPPNAKPNFSDKTYTSTSEWFSTFKRRYKNEKGEYGVIYVENLIDKLENVNSSSKILSRTLLEKTVIGLNNIIYTYKKDGQKEVAENYEKSKKRIEKLIPKNTKQFFNYHPKII